MKKKIHYKLNKPLKKPPKTLSFEDCNKTAISKADTEFITLFNFILEIEAKVK